MIDGIEEDQILVPNHMKPQYERKKHQTTLWLWIPESSGIQLGTFLPHKKIPHYLNSEFPER